MGCLSCGKAPEADYVARCLDREAKLAQAHSRSPAEDDDSLQVEDEEESLLGFHHHLVFQALWQEAEQGLPEGEDLPAFQQILEALVESISSVCRRKEHPAMLGFYHMAALSTHEDLEVQKKYLEHEHCILQQFYPEEAARQDAEIMALVQGNGPMQATGITQKHALSEMD